MKLYIGHMALELTYTKLWDGLAAVLDRVTGQEIVIVSRRRSKQRCSDYSGAGVIRLDGDGSPIEVAQERSA